jgi:hypothetical protein
MTEIQMCFMPWIGLSETREHQHVSLNKCDVFVNKCKLSFRVDKHQEYFDPCESLKVTISLQIF